MILPALIALGLLWSQDGPRYAKPIVVEAEPFPGLDEPRRVGCMMLRSGLTLTSSDDRFGGYSDLVLAGVDGRATFVSDAGRVLWLRLGFDEAGDVTSVSDGIRLRLWERDGSKLGKKDGDAEGLVWLGGDYAVSLEGENRIARMSPEAVLGQTLHPSETQTEILGANSGLEALAVLPGGDLVAISEATDPEGNAIVLRGRLDQAIPDWVETRYRPAEEFNVTGADVDPLTGDLWVLERAFSPLRGARMRVVRVRADRIGDAMINGEELTRMGFLEGVDNMEGLAVMRRADGTLRAVLISDDNFSAAQRTVLLTLGMAPGCEDGDAAKPPARRDAAAQ